MSWVTSGNVHLPVLFHAMCNKQTGEKKTTYARIKHKHRINPHGLFLPLSLPLPFILSAIFTSTHIVFCHLSHLLLEFFYCCHCRCCRCCFFLTQSIWNCRAQSILCSHCLWRYSKWKNDRTRESKMNVCARFKTNHKNTIRNKLKANEKPN